ncbi:hypothetical protein DOTSEDRAFT_67620 [Dothistroma septosporum NZE10]|uniref:Uncharacterized protein n=1 Tax=Dothistroma septosporum (strain NZE10 / CBS 128990) TaxID=675120 RepID=N1PYZ4_DOTSN|nr:hypothetical protein DOTSEDRAFT_67620 [Dothistroma septosporum NZE10]
MPGSICQICGERLCGSDLYSNPAMHFCIGLDGPAIVQTTSFVPKCLDSDCEEEFHVVEKKMPPPLAQPKAALSTHNPEDLEEIGRLHMEIEHLRQMLPKLATTPPAKPAVIKA